eukprot:SAG31_NODE_2788_length_5089_cov_7.201002_7_plen_90_part_01
MIQHVTGGADLAAVELERLDAARVVGEASRPRQVAFRGLCQQVLAVHVLAGVHPRPASKRRRRSSRDAEQRRRAPPHGHGARFVRLFVFF